VVLTWVPHTTCRLLCICLEKYRHAEVLFATAGFRTRVLDDIRIRPVLQVWFCLGLLDASGCPCLGQPGLKASFASQVTGRSPFFASTKNTGFSLQHCSFACADQPMHPRDKCLCIGSC